MKTKYRNLLILGVILVSLFAFNVVAAAWTPVNPPPYDLEFTRSDRNILPELVEGNTPLMTPGLVSFKRDYGMNGFTLGDDDSKWFDFIVDPEDLTKVFRVQIGKGDLGKIHILKWEAINLVVEHVLVKGGDYYFAYNYPEPFADDMHLVSPRTGANFQNIADISHFTVIFTDVPDETEATTTTEATTEVTVGTTEATTEATVETTEATTGVTVETTEATSEVTDETKEATTGLTDETTEATTEATDETTASSTIDIQDETLPLASATTATTAATETTQNTIVIDDEELPQTGESAAPVVVGMVLLAMAGSLFYILRRVRNQG